MPTLKGQPERLTLFTTSLYEALRKGDKDLRAKVMRAIQADRPFHELSRDDAMAAYLLAVTIDIPEPKPAEAAKPEPDAPPSDAATSAAAAPAAPAPSGGKHKNANGTDAARK